MREDTNGGQVDGGDARGTQAWDKGAVDLAAVFAALPGIELVLAPDAPRYTMLAATDGRLAATMTTRAGTLGRPLFDVFPDANPANDAASGVGNLRASLDTVLRTRAPHRMARQRYDLQRPDGMWEERYWEPLNVPVLGPDGAVRYLIHRVEDVTAAVRLAAEGDRLRGAVAGSERARATAEAARDEVAAANAQLQEQALELELANQQLQDQAGELEAQAEVLRETAESLRERTGAAERAMAALADSEARFRTVQDASPLGFAIHRPIREGGWADGRVVDFTVPYINDAGARVAGQPRDRILAGTLRGVWPGTVDAGLFADYVRVLETGEPLHRELLYEHAELEAGLAITGVRIGEGPAAELGLTFADITARLQAERERARLLAALGAERERLRSLVVQMPMPVALHEGPEHRFAIVNDAYQRSSGAWREVAGRTPPEAFPELEGSGIFERLDRVYATGEPWVAPETPMPFDREGTGLVEDAWFTVRFEPLRDAEGRVVGIINFSLDVTEQVRARQQVETLLDAERAARAEAEAANRAKGDFLAVMSHELRTPLNAIGGYAQLMELGLQGPVTPEQLAALGRIQRGQQHLLGLINSVLNYAKLEAGHVQYEAVDVPAAEALAEVAALVAPQARAKGLTLAAGPCAPELVARADPEKVRQVLLNLLSNAVKFTRAGGTVTVGGARAADGRVALTVADTGRGIPADQLARVFAPFVQVDQRLTRTEEGTGLGLAISRDLARGMGGDLTAESTPGVGSTFTLTLPAA
jgi:signal transduction histidine kinase